MGGDHISKFYKEKHPELAGHVEIVDEGIKLRLKASDKPVMLMIPIEIVESTKSKFDIKRGTRSISREEVAFSLKKIKSLIAGRISLNFSQVDSLKSLPIIFFNLSR